jgi:hypothetical protein
MQCFFVADQREKEREREREVGAGGAGIMLKRLIMLLVDVSVP